MPEKAPEQTNKPENVDKQLKDLQSRGIILSDKAEKQIKGETYPPIGELQSMASDMKSLKEMNLEKHGIAMSQVDINLGESLRRIGDSSEITAKSNQMRNLHYKYFSISNSIVIDKVRFYSGRGKVGDTKVPPGKKTYTEADLKKIHSMPLKKVKSWMRPHEKRVNLLRNLTKARLVPAKDYKKYRDMEPQKALNALSKIKKTQEKKEHASAGKTLDQDLAKIA